jgi:hypothetical protein
MRKISLFAEDYGHEVFLSPLLERLAEEYAVQIGITPYSVRGGFGKVIENLGDYVRDIMSYQQDMPDLIIVATDANCTGFENRRKLIQKAVKPILDHVIFAVPDPHVERWLLMDSAAFKQVFGKSCKAPDHKCDKDRYKNLLAQAVKHCGVTPLLGSMENAEDIVKAMDLKRMQKQDESLGNLLKELHSQFRIWKIKR